MKARGQDWVEFKLKPEAPDYVARGARRFSGAFRRGAEPFRCTRGEWLVFVAPMGYFEEIKVEKVDEGRISK